MRPEFEALISGWTLIDGVEPLTDRIEEVARWMTRNKLKMEDLSEIERKTIELMINTQIRRGVLRGDFDVHL